MKTGIFIFSALCLCGLVRCAAQYPKVHEQLTDAEFTKVFHRSRRDVPNYKLIKVESKNDHRAKRELRPVEIAVDDKKIQMNLHPSKHNVLSSKVPVWLAEANANTVYKPVDPEEIKINGIFYEDPKTMATLLAYYKGHYIYYDGVFGESVESKVVKSIPEKWWLRPGSFDNENHVVYGVQQSGASIPLDPHNIEEEEKLEKPIETFYPKLLVVVDHALFTKLGRDVQETIKYVATFWNAVNLKYSKIESPKVKILVTGIVISKDENALSYIYRAQNQTNLSHLNPFQMVNLARSYFPDEFEKATHFYNYDSSITMSNLETGINAGAAYTSEICSKDLNVGYVHDDGSFSGLLSGTHELGHLLSLSHDIKKGNGCEGYIDNVSTVMAPYIQDVKEFLWSDCSKRLLQEFAWNKKASCLAHQRRERNKE